MLLFLNYFPFSFISNCLLPWLQQTHSEQKYNQADFAVQVLNKRRRTRDPSIHVSTTESNIGESNDTSTFDILQEISDFLPMEEISEILPIEEISENLQEISDNIQEISQQDAVSILQPKTLDRDTLINISIFIFAIATILFQVLSVDVGITRGWMPEEIAYRLPIDNWRSYTEVLNTAPVQTKAVTSATVYAIGDIIAQRTEGLEVGELNRARIARSLAAGLIGHGPLSHVWYEVSEDFFENVLKLTEWWSFIPKVVIDQVCMHLFIIVLYRLVNDHFFPYNMTEYLFISPLDFMGTFLEQFIHFSSWRNAAAKTISDIE